MRPLDVIARALLAVAGLTSGSWSAVAQDASFTGVPVHVVVPVELVAADRVYVPAGR
jgi:hypothetical protein